MFRKVAAETLLSKAKEKEVYNLSTTAKVLAEV